MGLGDPNVSFAKLSVSWAMFINIVIAPMIVGQDLYYPNLGGPNMIVNLAHIRFNTNPKTACFRRESEVVSAIQNYIGKIPAVITYIVCASFLVYLEEVVIGYKMYNLHKKFLSFLVVVTSFDGLGQGRQKFFFKYYEEICDHHSRRLFIVGRESSVQLVLQNSILLYDYFKQPAMELYYQDFSNPTAWWRFINFIRITSIIISTYCTLMPLMEDFDMSCYKKHKKPASVIQHILHIIKIAIHILISTGLVFLKRIFK